MYKFDRQRYEERMAWYREARFGMFIHWGLYSIPARGEWVRSVEEMSEEAYMPYFYEFNPLDFEPKSWAHAAKEAGMRYVVMTAKHHDGFCLFDSQYTDFKVTNTKAGRDLVGEFVDAVRSEGLKVGLYYSLLDWHHPDYPHAGDAFHPMRNQPDPNAESRDFSRYVTYFHNQVDELCTNYGKLDLLWFDFSYGQMCGEKWGASKLIRRIRQKQPDIIINDRLEATETAVSSLRTGNPVEYHGDFVSPEQIIPPEGIRDINRQPLYWESCVTMNAHWGFCGTDHAYKPVDMLIKKLVECVSKGGNLLLNVGPDAKGRIPQESLDRLHDIGIWMKKNHESIYGCGMADLPKPEYGRITCSGNTLYFHIYENTIGPLPLIGIRKEDVLSVREVSTGYEIPLSASWVHRNYPELCFVDLGENPELPDSTDYVIAVKIRTAKENKNTKI